jgi:hypothetical protein
MRNRAGGSTTRPTAGTQEGGCKRLPAVSTATRTRGVSECRDGHIERRRPIDMGAKPASTPRPGERMNGLVGLGSTVCTPVMGGQRYNVESRPAGVYVFQDSTSTTFERRTSGGNGTRSEVSSGGEAEGEERTEAPTPGVSLLPRSRKGPTPLRRRRHGYGKAKKPVVQSRTPCSGHVPPPRGLQICTETGMACWCGHENIAAYDERKSPACRCRTA